MAWTDGLDRATGFIVSAVNWNELLGAAGSLMQLKSHAHGGTTGEGSQSIGPLVQEDFTDAAAPVAPGAGKTRLYATSGRPRFRAGAAGADLALLTEDMLDAKGDIITATAADAWTRKAVGSNGGVLTADSASSDGLEWVTLSTKGDLLVGQTSAKPVRVGVGTNDQVLVADSAQSSGVKWGGFAVSGVDGIKRAVKTADEIVTDTTLQNDDHLSFAVGANERWGFELFLRTTGPGIGDTSGFKFAFTLPTSATGYGVYQNNPSSMTAISDLTASTQLTSANSFNITMKLTGSVKVAGTAGTVQLQWAAVAGSGENVTVYEGAYLIATRVS